MGRTKTPPDQAEQEALQRVALLAAAALMQLRKPGRGKYESERQLAGWIQGAGVQFSASDLGPALCLAEATGKLVRPAVGPNTARPGELVTSGQLAQNAELYAAAELGDKDRIAALVDAVIRVLSSGRCDDEELQDRLVAAGVVCDPNDLDVALQRLQDSGRLMPLKPRPTVENPNPPRTLMMANLPAGFSQSSDPFDRIDSLGADVHASIKKRGYQFDSDEQLEEWLAADGVVWSGQELHDVLQQLEVSGWLSRPHRARDWPSDPLPGYLITPTWAR
jgi:hypothetical protein